jgi:hypothetical protein
MKRYLGKPLFRETGLPIASGAVMITSLRLRGRQLGAAFFKPTDIRMLTRHPSANGLSSILSEHALYLILFISNGGGW